MGLAPLKGETAKSLLSVHPPPPPTRFEDTGRRKPSASHKEAPHQNRTTLVPCSRPSLRQDPGQPVSSAEPPIGGLGQGTGADPRNLIFTSGNQKAGTSIFVLEIRKAKPTLWQRGRERREEKERVWEEKETVKLFQGRWRPRCGARPRSSRGASAALTPLQHFRATGPRSQGRQQDQRGYNKHLFWARLRHRAELES